MSTNYRVIIEKYAERHYIKNFAKKYKGAWDNTWLSMVEEFCRIDSLFGTSIVEIITRSKNGNIIIAKTEFRVAGTNESKKSSGNRCIVAIHKDIKSVNVLLIYHKNDLGNGNETAKWKQIIKDNYPDYRGLL